LLLIRSDDSGSDDTVTDVIVKNARYIADYVRIYDGSANEVLNTSHVVRESGQHYIDSATVGTTYKVDYLTPDVRPEIATIMGESSITSTLESSKQGIRLDKLVRLVKHHTRMTNHAAWAATMFSLGLACAAGTYDLSLIGDVYANDDVPTTMFSAKVAKSSFNIDKLYVVVP